jgi:hypothetical protein
MPAMGGEHQFWQKLHEIIEAEPLVDKFLPMYGELAALGIEKGKLFAPDARMAGLLGDSGSVIGREVLGSRNRPSAYGQTRLLLLAGTVQANSVKRS